MESSELLEHGISAAKAGKTAEARRLLTQVVGADSRNERAWLWLSGVVSSYEERSLCLENVLTLNPENRLARKGLERLVRARSQEYPEGQTAIPDESVGRNQVAAVEPEPIAPHQGTMEAGSPVGDAFDDVWATDDDICAYCASVVQEDAKRCTQCGRSLAQKEYRYAASVALHFYWVVLVGLSVTLAFHALFQLRAVKDSGVAITYAAIAAVLLLLVVGIYLRLFVAHIASLFVVISVEILSVLSFYKPFDPVALGPGNVDPAVFGVAGDFVGRLSLFLKIVQVTVATLALFYALFRVSPEFDRVTVRLVAECRKGLHTAVDFHMNARRFAAEGKWASAILHWQRAAAIEPASIVYQRNLAKAYLRLGFYERGYGILQHAKDLPMQPETEAEISRLLHWSRRKLAAASKVA